MHKKDLLVIFHFDFDGIMMWTAAKFIKISFQYKQGFWLKKKKVQIIYVYF